MLEAAAAEEAAAETPETVDPVVPIEPVPALKEKNLNAKLGRLNSLNRNINAYINSKSPNFADVQAFVMASAEAEFAEGALAAEQEELQALQDELIALEGIAQPTQAQLDRIAALSGLITTQQGVVTDAVDDAADAQEALALAGTLEDALDEMSNKPIDPDVVTWAEGVLGVGENVGKIDEMREMLEAAVADEAAAETPAQASSTSSAARPALATATSAAVAPSASGPSDIGLPQSLKPRSTLPCEGDGCPPSRDGGDAVALQPPWRSIRAIPNPVVRVCALAIETAARSYGAVGVDASSSGPLRRQGRGTLAPLQVRIQYSRQGGIEIRQAQVTCHLDAAGGVADIT